MKKYSRFLPGILSVVLAAQPMVTYAEEFTQTQEAFTQSEEAESGIAEEEAEGFGGLEDMDFSEAFTDEENSSQEEELEENGFLDDVKLAEAQDTPDEEQSEEFYMTDEVEAPVKASDGMPSGISLFSLGYYGSSYGEQLDEEPGNLYGRLVERYVTNYKMGLYDEDYADLEVNLLDRIYFEASLDESGKMLQDENFSAARAELKYIVQAAVDAFSYDHPEVFWFRGCNYTFGYGYTKKSDGSCQGYINSNIKLQLGSKEIETDAHKDMEEFMASVDRTVDTLKAELGNASTPEKVEKIHDYVCLLGTYKGADDPGNLVVHSARPAFLGTDHGFVCEGYAKTMKILCDRLGVNCACVSGLAKSTASGTAGAHMWNYVQMDEGKWYLVDATWDDTKDPQVPYSTYLMAGWNSPGFYIKVREERTENGDLSASQGMQFTFPQIEEELYHTDAYHRWSLIRKDKEPSCTETGSGDYRCTYCGEEKTQVFPALGHQLTKISAVESTCISQGNGEYWKCERCGKYFSDEQGTKETTVEEMILPFGDHRYVLAATEKAPTCTESGKDLYRCSLCGETKTETVPATGHQLTKIGANASTCTVQGNTEYWKCTKCGKLFSDEKGTRETTETAVKLPLASHSYGEYKTQKEATVLAEGTKAAVCSGCGKTITASIARLTPTMKLNASSLTLKVRQSYTIKVSGLSKGDKVVKWKSSNSKIAAVSSKGKVTGKKKGSATITVTLASGLSKKISIKVQNGTVKTTKVKINTKSVTLAKKGKKYQLTTTVSPVTSQEKVTYTSSNKKVATVSSKGKITAKGKGTAVITVRSGSKKATCKVTVKK